MQRSDSPARNVPGFWLGDPSSNFRMPFDATFTAWKVWALSLAPAFVLLWFVLPFGLFLALVVRAVAQWARPKLPLMLWRRKPRQGQVAGFFTAVLLLGIFPSPRTWLLPLPWYFAFLAAPLASLFVTRTVMPWITTNTPISYWRSLLPRIAGGPRARRLPSTYQATVGTLELREYHELELLALTIDPREVRMPTATPRVKPVEFFAWTPAIPHQAAEAISWASVHGARCMVNPETNVLALIVAEGEAIYANPGHVVILDHTGAFHTVSAAHFARDFNTESDVPA